MTPKLAGLASKLKVMHHGLDAQADKLMKRIDVASDASNAAFAKAHATIDQAEAAVQEVEQFVSGLGTTNGGPTLDGSSESSGVANGEPAASWGGQQK